MFVLQVFWLPIWMVNIDKTAWISPDKLYRLQYNRIPDRNLSIMFLSFKKVKRNIKMELEA